MATPSANDLTRQQLDELDSLLQRMLSSPSSTPHSRPAPAPRFSTLGQTEPEHPAPGEVIFADDAALVSARRWCWRQSAGSAARDDTTTVLIAVEAQHAGGRADVAAALRDLLALLPLGTGSAVHSAILDRDHPAFVV